jgi:hypothetical protein
VRQGVFTARACFCLAVVGAKLDGLDHSVMKNLVFFALLASLSLLMQETRSYQ